MKRIKRAILRYYHLLCNRNKCFHAPLNKRLESKFDIVERGDIYLGKDWYYRPR